MHVQLQSPAAFPREILVYPCLHWIRGWVSPRATLDTREGQKKRKNNKNEDIREKLKEKRECNVYLRGVRKTIRRKKRKRSNGDTKK
jgi:hypothetical protein